MDGEIGRLLAMASATQNGSEGVAVFRVDLAARSVTLAYCNKKYEMMSGRRRAELAKAGNLLLLQKHLANDREMGEKFRKVAGGVAFEGMYEWMRPDGRSNLVEYFAIPFTVESKEVLVLSFSSLLKLDESRAPITPIHDTPKTHARRPASSLTRRAYQS